MVQESSVAAQPVAARRGLSRRQRRTLAFYGFISPWLIIFILLGVIPLILGFMTSLTNYDGLNLLNLKFTGLANYQRALTDPDARFSFTRTIYWLFANLPTYLILSFLLALILNQNIKGRGLFRTLYYLPSIVPGAAAILAWKILLDKNNGIINGIISMWRPGTAIGWLSDYSMIGMTAIAVWGGLGFGMVIFLSGLQGIPDELVEAARIDGASNFQIFTRITLPLMTPVVFYMLIQGLIGAFSQLNLPILLNNTGLTGNGAVPSRQIYLFMVHAYTQIFTNRRYGYGTALMWIMFIVAMIVTGLVFWSAKYWVYTEASRDGDNK